MSLLKCYQEKLAGRYDGYFRSARRDNIECNTQINQPKLI